MEEKKYYPVFSVDVCFDAYAMNEILVAAESRDDLIAHLVCMEFLNYISAEDKKRLVDDYWRINKVPNLFSDKPYMKLEEYAYYE